MKLEALCPECGHAYVLDERGIDPSVPVPCPACGQLMDPPGPVRRSGDRSSPSGAAPAAPSGPAQPREAGAVAAATAAQARTDPVAEDVVCPRCGLHFQPRQEHRAAAGTAGRKTVLVVEDMDYFLEIARDSLGERFDVKTARTFDEAWRSLAGGGVDLLILDLTLEGADRGRSLLEQLKYKPCPILIFTARDEAEMYGNEWDQLKSLGADDMVLKGMQVGESLLRKACELLGEPWDEDDLS